MQRIVSYISFQKILGAPGFFDVVKLFVGIQRQIKRICVTMNTGENHCMQFSKSEERIYVGQKRRTGGGTCPDGRV